MMDKNETTKWREIYDDLLDDIKDGKYSQRKFPSETQLARRYGCGRLTVQTAIGRLESEGIVRREKGSGTFLTRKARNASGRLGLIMPSLAFGEIFPLICQELTRCAQTDGYSFVLGDISAKRPEDRAHEACKVARQFVEQGVAGVVLQPLAFLKTPERVTKEILRLFQEAEIPVVLIDRDVDLGGERIHHDFVGIDNLVSGRALGAHLLAQGAKRIHFLMRPNCASAIRDRLDGVMSAVGARRVDDDVIVAEPDDSDTLKKWFGHKKGRPDAVVCESDYVAARFRNTLAKFKLRVPEDVLLAGFDDVNFAQAMTPPLTTVHQPCGALAAQAYHALRERMENPLLPPRRILLPASLVIRESTSSEML